VGRKANPEAKMKIGGVVKKVAIMEAQGGKKRETEG